MRGNSSECPDFQNSVTSLPFICLHLKTGDESGHRAVDATRTACYNNILDIAIFQASKQDK
jgi:hypothetical protein